MEIRWGSPPRGESLERLKAFLRENGLSYDERIEFSVCVMKGDTIAAAGSLDGRILKCVAVSPAFQNEGLAAAVVTELVQEAGRRGIFHLFVFTKPEHETLFGNLGFFTIEKTGSVLLMENRREGISHFVAELSRPPAGASPADTSPAGAVIVNCNPFTLGHRYLIETAAARCGALHVFVVSEDHSRFPPDLRYELVVKGTAHIPHVYVHPTGPYLISAQTFPDYFFRSPASPLEAAERNMDLDITIFSKRFARPLGIQRRFVGTEPLDPVTAAYNRRLTAVLPSFGIELIEIPRLERGGRPVSASRVRDLLDQGDPESLRDLVPPTTIEGLKKFQQGIRGIHGSQDRAASPGSGAGAGHNV